MPCFSSGPPPGTPAYEEWLPKVRADLSAFAHVVDYYYGRAGLPVPELVAADESLGYPSAKELALGASKPVDPGENARVLQQVLMHLECDGVGMLQLHELRLLLHADPASEGHRYAGVLAHCFGVMRLDFHERPTNDTRWRACHNPWVMLDCVECHTSDRKLRLFAAACCRRLPHVLTDERCRAAVEAAESHADGGIGDAALAAAATVAEDVTNRHGTTSPAAAVAEANAIEAARGAALYASVESDEGREGEQVLQAALVRCVFGNPFRPVAFSPDWRTTTAVTLAQQMYDAREFGPLPILADALQDAGGADETVLSHCRGPGPHARGCWVVDLVLGKE